MADMDILWFVIGNIVFWTLFVWIWRTLGITYVGLYVVVVLLLWYALGAISNSCASQRAQKIPAPICQVVLSVWG
jgi:hypothetical protein